MSGLCFIRADASVAIGTGHVMRCLALAHRLRERGAAVVFLCRDGEGSLIGEVSRLGYDVHVLPEGIGWRDDARLSANALAAAGQMPDALIVDHYGLDARYEAHVRPHVRRVVVVDDLADRPHDCDLLLDQNRTLASDDAVYRPLVGSGCRLLLGPRYALLRAEFAEARKRAVRREHIGRAIVSFGGVDPTGETLKTVRALAPLTGEGLRVTVLVGRFNRQAESIARMARLLPNVRCIGHSDNVASLMLEADLAIGSGGTTTWERCCLGLPAIVVTVADNQTELTDRAVRAGAALHLGRSEEVDEARIRDALVRLVRHPHEASRMSGQAMACVDGLGASRVAKELIEWAG